jgi:hypothetical protein
LKNTAVDTKKENLEKNGELVGKRGLVNKEEGKLFVQRNKDS